MISIEKLDLSRTHESRSVCISAGLICFAGWCTEGWEIIFRKKHCRRNARQFRQVSPFSTENLLHMATALASIKD